MLAAALEHPADGVRALLPRAAVTDADIIPVPRIHAAYEEPLSIRGKDDPDWVTSLVVHFGDSGRGSTISHVWTPGARDAVLEFHVVYTARGPAIERNWRHASTTLRVALWSLARLMRVMDSERRVMNGVQLVDCRAGWIWPITPSETDPTISAAFGLQCLVRDTTPYGPGGS